MYRGLLANSALKALQLLATRGTAVYSSASDL